MGCYWLRCMDSLEKREVMITIEQSATDKILDLIKQEEDSDIKGLRIFVEGGGCSGFQYGFTWENKISDDDFSFDLEGSELKVLVDPMSAQYLQGSTIEYQKTIMAEQFAIRNPNAQTKCGCGSSFSV